MVNFFFFLFFVYLLTITHLLCELKSRMCKYLTISFKMHLNLIIISGVSSCLHVTPVTSLYG